MQDVTTLEFMQVVGRCGSPDFFFTEYFRVHEHSTLEKHILRSILEHETGRPVFAQLIGERIDDLRRTALELQQYPIAGIDLNMGCPAPKVYKKNVGGGLLRDPDTVDRILGALRDAIKGRFSVKMRIGFDSGDTFEELLTLLAKHQVDLLSLHGRTVKEGYRSEVHYDYIRWAAQALPCPVFANGNILSAENARDVLRYTGAAGVMMGRHAIRNPWIFRQTRELFAGKPIFRPRLADVRLYIEALYHAVKNPDFSEKHRVNHMKKFLNFVGLGVDPDGDFLYRMRRAKTKADLFSICDAFMIHDGKGDRLFTLEPYEGLVARPNCESPRANHTNLDLQAPVSQSA
jgi:tRNA-dihydrouridine synthase